MRLTAITMILGFLLSVCSCGDGSGRDAQWEEIDRLCDSVPEEAVGILDTLDQTGLSERDLNRYRLLWIKSRDKAFIAHTTDTLILDVVDYYAHHRSEGLYPEALYYGGRVYSDLGDLPTALEFFQKSLDEIPEDDAYLHFKSTVLNQTGRLLHALRLDSAAVDYLERSLQTNPDRDKDYYNVAFTHSLIAESNKGQKKIQTARRHIDEAVRIGTMLNQSDKFTLQAELAYMLQRENKIDSALLVIRPLPGVVDSLTMPFCLAIAADIYKDAGIPDTAYMYARLLTNLKSPHNKRIGYRVIFANELKDFVPNDTLLKLIPEYKQTIEDYLNTHEADQALIQNARYNYSTHLKKQEASERKLRLLQERLRTGGWCLIVMLLIFLSAFLWYRYGKAKKDISSMTGYLLTEKVKETVRESREEKRGEVDEKQEEDKETPLANGVENPAQAKARILRQLELVKENNPLELISRKIKEAQIYRELNRKAENKESMGDLPPWIQIEDLIRSVSPDFDIYLDILTENKISSAERRVALLMKLGFSNTQIADLLNRAPATVSKQRSSIASKIGCDRASVDSVLIRL